MKKLYPLLLLFLLLFSWSSSGLSQPPGFVDQEFVGGFEQAVGLTFDANGRMYVWEKGGKIWIVEDGQRLANPLLDISEEVGNCRDFGMLGVTLDPNFLSNGYIYLLYIVDRHHLLYAGTSNYNPNTNEYFDATIGRITRYQAEASTDYTTVDYNSRTVLLGATPSTGFPNLHQSHGTGSLIFGTDGSLLASFGDGASYSSVDEGSASETYYQQAIDDGIIPASHNIGAYRVQLTNSLAGKVVRIDPQTGAGLPSNPFYNSNNPFSVASRTWATGLRNPCRMTKRPGTGSHDSEDGDPGNIYIGDVGWGTREELNVMNAPGLNFGWPKYEGMTHQPGYNNNTYAPPSHELAKVDWRNGLPRAYVNGTIYNVGSQQVPGPSFEGNASIGGVWYEGNDFPSEYQNTYFHADYGGDWIRNFVFDADDNCTEIRNFKTGADAIVFIATDPFTGGLYYIGGASGGNNNPQNSVRKISYTGGNLPPIVVANANVMYGSSPLAVQFKGELSYDPDGDPLSFSWNFGDGSTSTEVNPSHTFTTSSNQPTSFTVTLTVSDDEGLSESQELTISLNNTPPQIISTSIDNTNTYGVGGPTTLNLSATVSDSEHNNNQLDYAWITELHHNDHFHQEPIDDNPVTTTELSPIGCDGTTYFYRIKLTVSDPAGLSSSFQKDIFPACTGNSQTINFAPIPDKLTIDGPFTLTASASSGLPVLLHVIEGPAIISGNTVTLTGNPGTVTIRAIQNGNSNYIPAIPVEHSFIVSPPGGTGLTARYYNNMTFGNFAFERIDPVVDFDWGTGSPDPSMGANTFSIRWEGEVLPVYSEIYTFTTTTDDGVRLWVNDQLIINQWIDQSPTQHSGNISLTAGQRVPITMEFYENGGGAVARLAWSSSSQSAQIIPQFLLFPEGEAPDTEPPTVVLTTPSNEVSGDFVVSVAFNEDINGLSLNDFNITNGTASGLSGSGQSFTFTVSPQANGNVSVRLPANRVQDDAGNNNLASNTLNVNYTEPDPGDCTTASNIALDKPATQSSNYGATEAGAELAVDGNTSGDWYLDFSVSSTSWQNNPWWEVDLESVSEIQEVKVWNRTDCCAANLSNYYILISDMPFSSNNLNDLLNDPAVFSFHESTPAGTPTTISTNVNGRYVRLQRNGTGFVQLAEVEVMGCEGMPADDTTPPEVTLSTVNINVTAPFPVQLDFSESVSGLTLSDLSVTNGTTSNLNGNGAAYTVTVTPTAEGVVTIQLPANQVEDAAGNLNNASNTLSVNYSEPMTGDCTVPINLALNQNTSQSSDYSGNEAGAELAVDGNTNGNWYQDFSVSSTSWQNNPWWEVELAELSTITEIKVWSRTDCCANFLSNYYVFVSDFPFLSDDLNETLNQAGVSNYHQTEIAGSPTTIPIGRTGRYIRIQSNLTGFVQLAEVEVMGCPGETDPGDDTTPPEATLSTASTEVDGVFTVDCAFNEIISGLNINDFTLTNGSASDLSGNGLNYSFSVLPLSEGSVTIQLPANQVNDLAGNGNNASNTLNVNYTEPVNGGDCATLDNLSLNAIASQSSVYAGGGAGPELAIDDNTSGDWYRDFSVSSTGWENQPWWEADLGGSFQIDELRIWNRTDCCTNFLNDYYILISEVPFVSGNLNEVLNQAGVSSYLQSTVAGSPSTVTIGQSGRYVRLQKTGAGFMALAEVEIMGCDLNNSNNQAPSLFTIPGADENRGLQIRLYPNPANEYVIIEYETAKAGKLTYLIANGLGTTMEEESFFADIGRGKIVIPMHQWTAGFYTFYMKLDGFRFQRAPFIKIRD